MKCSSHCSAGPHLALCLGHLHLSGHARGIGAKLFPETRRIGHLGGDVGVGHLARDAETLRGGRDGALDQGTPRLRDQRLQLALPPR